VGANRKWCELQLVWWSVKAMCSGRTNRLQLSFSAAFALFVRELALSGLRFFGSFFFRKKKEQKTLNILKLPAINSAISNFK